MSTQPYGFCIVRDRNGTAAVTHVPREMCESGYASNGPPVASFACEAPEPAYEEGTAARRRGATKAAGHCAILPGTWVESAVVTVPATDANATSPFLCYSIVDPAALAGVEFAIPWTRPCEPGELPQ